MPKNDGSGVGNKSVRWAKKTIIAAMSLKGRIAANAVLFIAEIIMQTRPQTQLRDILLESFMAVQVGLLIVSGSVIERTIRSRNVAEKIIPTLPAEASEEIQTGVRIWNVATLEDGSPRLRSIVNGQIWEPGKPMTGDPDEDSSSGVHAFKEDDNLDAYAIGNPRIKRGSVRGEVALWGRMIEYEKGWCAEFGYPASIESGDNDLALRLARTYGCDIRTKMSEPAMKRN